MGGTEHDQATPGAGGPDEDAPAAPATPMTPAAPSAAPTGPAAADQVKARWAAFGRNEQLAVGGGIVILAAYLLGILLENWGLGLSSILVLLATIAVIVVVAMGITGAAGMSRTAILRVDAGIVGAYALTDLGDAIHGLGFWSTLDVAFTLAYVAGTVALMVGVWRLTGGDIVKDVAAFIRAPGRTLPERLVGLGAAGVIIGWTILLGVGWIMRTEGQLGVVFAVLALAVIWLGGSGAGEYKLPISHNITLAALGVATAVLALLWLVRIVDELSGESILSLGGVILYVVAAAAMAGGGLLGMQPTATPGSTGTAGSTGGTGGTAG